MELNSNSDLRKNYQTIKSPSKINGLREVKESLKAINSLRGLELTKAIKVNFATVNQLCLKLKSSPENGIDNDVKEIARRKEIFGANSIPARQPKSFFLYLLEAFLDVTLIILIFASICAIILSFVSHHNAKDPTEKFNWIESASILVAVVIIVLITAFFNWSQEKQFYGIIKLINQRLYISTIRSGNVEQVNVTELVVGDVCFVKYGDMLPTDGLLLQGNDLKVDESSLTGEAKLVCKDLNTDPKFLKGTQVMEGFGKMLVTSVGVDTENGRILCAVMGHKNSGDEAYNKEPETAKLKTGGHFTEMENDLTSSSNKSIIKRKIDKIVITVSKIGLLVALLTLLALIIRFSVEKFVIEQHIWSVDFITNYISFIIICITILIIVIPEGLPLAIMLSMTLSVKRMMLDNNFVRHLEICETMGNATCICSDKTGTLTTNSMTVVSCHVNGKNFYHTNNWQNFPNFHKELLGLAISINSSYTSKIKIASNKQNEKIGNSTECALLEFVNLLGLDYREIRSKHHETTFFKVYTFNSERKYMGTVIKMNTDTGVFIFRLFVKGASEIVISRCTRLLDDDGSQKLMNDLSRLSITEEITNMTEEGQRTLCIASRDFSDSPDDINWNDEEAIIKNLTFIGLFGIEDPVRPEVPEAIKKVQTAGIIVRMITGDNLKTAKAIALKCNIINHRDMYENKSDTKLFREQHGDGVVMNSQTFNERIKSKPDGPVEQELIDKVWPRLRVLARSTPLDKYNLVKGIMESGENGDGEIVAVTGDGTNDGPALKKAHVGFAMGISGTDVAKEASDIILLDDSFTSIIRAVIWGRHIYDSVSKFIQFQLTVNYVAVTLTFLSACFLGDSPLKAVHMIWINLIEDTLASLSLSTEYPCATLLNRKPYSRYKSIVSCMMTSNIFLHGTYQIAILLILVFLGDNILGIESGKKNSLIGLPSQHYTFIFNTMVLLTLFNEINCRKIDGSLNPFAGILSNAKIFILIWITSFFLQFIIIEWGDLVLFTVPLTLSQWLWCIFLGISQLLIGIAINLFYCVLPNQWNEMTSTDKPNQYTELFIVTPPRKDSIITFDNISIDKKKLLSYSDIDLKQ